MRQTIAAILVLAGAASALSIPSSVRDVPAEEPPVEEEPAPWTPPPPPADPSWEAAYRRCFTDGVDGVRALNFGSGVDKNYLTIDRCLDACAAGGFKLAGLEYGRECYCGNTLQGENVPTLDERCDIPCVGNNKTTCGGDGALALYVKDKFEFTEGKAFDGLGHGYEGYEPVGCYQDFHAFDRTLKVDALRGPESNFMTPELCIKDCQARGFPLAGLEYGRQCFCGHDRSGRSNKTEDFYCNQGCTGNAQLFCGGNWNLVIYSKDGVTPVIAPPPPPPPSPPPPPPPADEPPVPVEEHAPADEEPHADGPRTLGRGVDPPPFSEPCVMPCGCRSECLYPDLEPFKPPHAPGSEELLHTDGPVKDPFRPPRHQERDTDGPIKDPFRPPRHQEPRSEAAGSPEDTRTDPSQTTMARITIPLPTATPSPTQLPASPAGGDESHTEELNSVDWDKEPCWWRKWCDGDHMIWWGHVSPLFFKR